jgi:hypothetical protein
MAAITISFIYDSNTQQRELWVDYESEADWIPVEHERRHLQIVKQLLANAHIAPADIERMHIRVAGQIVAEEALTPEDDALQVIANSDGRTITCKH